MQSVPPLHENEIQAGKEASERPRHAPDFHRRRAVAFGTCKQQLNRCARIDLTGHAGNTADLRPLKNFSCHGELWLASALTEEAYPCVP